MLHAKAKQDWRERIKLQTESALPVSIHSHFIDEVAEALAVEKKVQVADELKSQRTQKLIRSVRVRPGFLIHLFVSSGWVFIPLSELRYKQSNTASLPEIVASSTVFFLLSLRKASRRSENTVSPLTSRKVRVLLPQAAHSLQSILFFFKASLPRVVGHVLQLLT